MKVALVGNPNCGKTLLFNKICRKNMPVGNRAGVTVSVKNANFFAGTMYDLPGIYSLKNPKNEEKITSDFLHNEDVDLILNIVDFTRFPRSLHLTAQLINLGKPTIVVLNMRDEAEKRKINVNLPLLSRELGCPVFFISARKDRDFNELFQIPKKPCKVFPSDAAACFDRLENICASAVSAGKKPSLNPDKILLNKYLAFPTFLTTMVTLLTLCSVLSNITGELVSNLIANLSETLVNTNLSGNFRALLSDGILTGVGGVLQFLPPVILLTFALNIMEDCGYLTRVAYLTDKLFSSFGMSGRTAISLILGCGCTVPAVMSVRTIPSKSEKIRCVGGLHLIPCNAKLPLFSLLISSVFSDKIFVLPLTYLLSVLLFFLFCALYRKTEQSPFIMEMPEMRLPDIGNCVKLSWRTLRGFLFRVCTVVFLASILVWVLSNYNFGFRKCNIEYSVLAKICNSLKYIFYPIGLTDWRFSAAIISGYAGKETVVGVIGILANGNLSQFFTLREGIVFYLFILVSSPCAAALSAIKNELGTREFLKCVLRQNAFAFTLCAVVNLALLLLKLA